jgi:UDP-glucuronate 4-epimerase
MTQQILITGIAGFIGSHTAQLAREQGFQVRGIDSLTDYYDPTLKLKNLNNLRDHDICDVTKSDLLSTDLDQLLDGVDAVLHCAAQPGVRDSWRNFEHYVSSNVLVTQKLLDASVRRGIKRFAYSSSSSIYGDALTFPVHETDLQNPVSPYGITKLAGEKLCNSYTKNFDLSVVSLRYFTVYGPRQRPDMAIHRLISSALQQKPFPLYGDGSFIRDFTYVADVANANLLALIKEVPSGTAMNIAGGESTSMSDLIEIVGDLVGKSVPIDSHSEQPGDVIRTGGATQKASELLGWKATTVLHDGLRAQIEYLRKL